MHIQKSAFSTLTHNPKKSLVTYTALPETGNQTDEDFKAEGLATVEFVEKYRPCYFLSDLRDFHYVTRPELQVWAAKNTTPRYGLAGVRKIAIVASKAYIAQLSVEQTATEAEQTRKAHGLALRYFASIDEAEAWFFNTEKVNTLPC